MNSKLILDSVDCKWGEWRNGHCSVTCGGGIRTKTRTKITEESNGGTCNGTASQTEICNTNHCPNNIQTGLAATELNIYRFETFLKITDKMKKK